MKNAVQNNWRVSRSHRRFRFDLDQISFMGVLTALIFIYILFHFIYPMISKGLLW
ncbi:hypothetical protein [Tellurirhabdus rosea]|uniref:hypothetical protein n=1 Tax=Tellurirhabdus rosea TaxID=2674997 RepID=UPI00224DC35E|nr:hypothetical protein [Tellurirhabdus rosea]